MFVFARHPYRHTNVCDPARHITFEDLFPCFSHDKWWNGAAARACKLEWGGEWWGFYFSLEMKCEFRVPKFSDELIKRQRHFAFFATKDDDDDDDDHISTIAARKGNIDLVKVSGLAETRDNTRVFVRW